MPPLASATAWTISLIAIFVVLFGGLVNGIIVYALVQTYGEYRQNRQDRLPS